MSGIRRFEIKRYGVVCEVCGFFDEVEFASGTYGESKERWKHCTHKNSETMLLDECPNWIIARKAGVRLD